MKTLEILVTVLDLDEVSVRWLVPLDRAGAGVYNALRDTILELDGVEKVSMHRYSADVWVASHVAVGGQVADAIVEALSDRASDFQHAVRFHSGETLVDVKKAI